MMQFNLLLSPEDKKRKQRKKLIRNGLIMLFLNLFAVFSCYQHLIQMVVEQKQTQIVLQTKLRKLQQKRVANEALLPAVLALQQDIAYVLQIKQKQKNINTVFMILNTQTPETVFFTNIAMHQQQWLVKGIANDIYLANKMLVMLQNKTTLKQLKLLSSASQDDSGQSNFSITGKMD